MSDQPENLSDIHLEVDGYTQQDVINNRKAKLDMIREGAIQGDPICAQAMWLDAEARAMGIDVTYSEELDDDDFL